MADIDGIGLYLKAELRATTRNQRMRESAVMRSSVIPSAKYVFLRTPAEVRKGKDSN